MAATNLAIVNSVDWSIAITLCVGIVALAAVRIAKAKWQKQRSGRITWIVVELQPQDDALGRPPADDGTGPPAEPPDAL